MGSKSTAFEQALLDLVFLNAAIPLVGDAGGLLASVADGNLYVSLHTASPGESGNQTTSETAYTSYARVAVPRDGTGWVRTGSTVANFALVEHPKCTAAPGADITHFGIGASVSGAGLLLYYGTLPTPIDMEINTQPQASAGAITVVEG